MRYDVEKGIRQARSESSDSGLAWCLFLLIPVGWTFATNEVFQGDPRMRVFQLSNLHAGNGQQRKDLERLLLKLEGVSKSLFLKTKNGKIVKNGRKQALLKTDPNASVSPSASDP